jgi:hypothetical protein
MTSPRAEDSVVQRVQCHPGHVVDGGARAGQRTLETQSLVVQPTTLDHSLVVSSCEKYVIVFVRCVRACDLTHSAVVYYFLPRMSSTHLYRLTR